LADFSLRPATEKDAPAIQRLIHEVEINPSDLDWHHFVLAVDRSGTMLGCGQLKPHGKDIVEMASIAVKPAFRSLGSARAIIEHLIERAPRPLYLTCRAGLETFYAKWDFRKIEYNEMPAYFRRLMRLAKAWGLLMNEGLLVMKLM
jgi:N-acetylglutamate synthase-like GNAT family acetyltransferase